VALVSSGQASPSICSACFTIILLILLLFSWWSYLSNKSVSWSYRIAFGFASRHSCPYQGSLRHTAFARAYSSASTWLFASSYRASSAYIAHNYLNQKKHQIMCHSDHIFLSFIDVAALESGMYSMYCV